MRDYCIVECCIVGNLAVTIISITDGANIREITATVIEIVAEFITKAIKNIS